MRTALKVGLVTVLATIFTAISSGWSYYQAQAAVSVRPELANVGAVDAWMTGHGVDWLFYNMPLLGVGINFTIMFVGIGVVVWAHS